MTSVFSMGQWLVHPVGDGPKGQLQGGLPAPGTLPLSCPRRPGLGAQPNEAMTLALLSSLRDDADGGKQAGEEAVLLHICHCECPPPASHTRGSPHHPHRGAGCGSGVIPVPPHREGACCPWLGYSTGCWGAFHWRCWDWRSGYRHITCCLVSPSGKAASPHGRLLALPTSLFRQSQLRGLGKRSEGWFGFPEKK